MVRRVFICRKLSEKSLDWREACFLSDNRRMGPSWGMRESSNGVHTVVSRGVHFCVVWLFWVPNETESFVHAIRCSRHILDEQSKLWSPFLDLDSSYAQLACWMGNLELISASKRSLSSTGLKQVIKFRNSYGKRCLFGSWLRCVPLPAGWFCVCPNESDPL